MTMKTVLLGAAAGLVTVGAAQAADLPMTKAEAVEYVKVCTEFGEGFFYIPGTDTCLKIAGEVRANYQFQSRHSRDTDVTGFGVDARLKFDARTQTEYGQLRSYIQTNFVAADGNNHGLNIDKAFIQFGGLTAGFAHTFFGIYDADYGNTVFAGYFSSQSTVNLLAYTAVFGGGFSATLSVEDGRDHRGVLTNGSPDVTIDAAGNGYGGQSMPDIVGNLRVDQGWGEAAVFAAVHEIRYPQTTFDNGVIVNPTISDDTPGSDYGFAVGGGIGWNTVPFLGMHAVIEGTYAKGASNYLGLGANDALFSVGPVDDIDTDLGHGWSVTGELGGNFSPNLGFTLFGSYVDYSDTSLDLGAANGSVTVDGFKSWIAGANLTYTVVKGLTVAGEVAYNDFNPDSDDPDVDDVHSWTGGMRIKRTF